MSDFESQDQGLITPPTRVSGKDEKKQVRKAPDAPQRKLKPRSLNEVFEGINDGFPSIRAFPTTSPFSYDECFDFVHLHKAKHCIEVFLLNDREGDTELKPFSENPKPKAGIFVRAILRHLPDTLDQLCLVDWLDRWTGELWQPKGDFAPELGQVNLAKDLFAWRLREQFADHKLEPRADKHLEDLAISSFLKKYRNSDKLHVLQSAHAPYWIYAVAKADNNEDKCKRYLTALAEVDERIPNSIGVFPHGVCMVSVCGHCKQVEDQETPDGSCPKCGVKTQQRDSSFVLAHQQYVSKGLTDKMLQGWVKECKYPTLDYRLIYKPRDVVEMHTLYEGARYLLVLDVHESWMRVFAICAETGKLKALECPESLPVVYKPKHVWNKRLHTCVPMRLCGCEAKEKNADASRCAFGRFGACSDVMVCGCKYTLTAPKVQAEVPKCGGCYSTDISECTCTYTMRVRRHGNIYQSFKVNASMKFDDLVNEVCEHFGEEVKGAALKSGIQTGVRTPGKTLGNLMPEVTHADLLTHAEMAPDKPKNKRKVIEVAAETKERMAAESKIKKPRVDFVPGTPEKDLKSNDIGVQMYYKGDKVVIRVPFGCDHIGVLTAAREHVDNNRVYLYYGDHSILVCHSEWKEMSHDGTQQPRVDLFLYEDAKYSDVEMKKKQRDFEVEMTYKGSKVVVLVPVGGDFTELLAVTRKALNIKDFKIRFGDMMAEMSSSDWARLSKDGTRQPLRDLFVV